MITTVKLVVQQPLREALKVKMPDVLHHGEPVVPKRAGGISLQIQHGKPGFLVEVGDTDPGANHLFGLYKYTNNDLYTGTSEYAKASVSGEVEAVGNAACWSCLATKLASGQVLKPNA